MRIAGRCLSPSSWAAVLAIVAASAAVPTVQAAPVGSVSLETLRSCSRVGADAVCDGTGPGQGAVIRQYAGGIGVAGSNTLDAGGGNTAYSDVSFGGFDLPVIRAATQASGDVRMNTNVFGFQSYLVGGSSALDFSVSGSLHIVDSSTNPGGSGLPGGAGLTGYLGIWDASILDGYGSDPQSLFEGLFYADCSVSGVRGLAYMATSLSGGEQSYTLTTSACSAGSLTFSPGEELLVVAGLQIPVNRGGFVDATHTFTTSLDPALSSDAQAQILANVQSAIERGAVVVTVPEPASLALVMTGVLGLAACRRRR